MHHSFYFTKLIALIKGPILYCFSSISHSCQTSNTEFDMHCPKPIHGSEFQLSKSQCRCPNIYGPDCMKRPLTNSLITKDHTILCLYDDNSGVFGVFDNHSRVIVA